MARSERANFSRNSQTHLAPLAVSPERPAPPRQRQRATPDEAEFVVCKQTIYRATQIYSGPVRFVLAASGHIAGVVNPPDSGKYSHWVNESLPPDPEEWFKGATEFAGSWWPDWQRWVTAQGGDQVPARSPGTGRLSTIEDAPGSYVRVMATD